MQKRCKFTKISPRSSSSPLDTNSVLVATQSGSFGQNSQGFCQNPQGFGEDSHGFYSQGQRGKSNKYKGNGQKSGGWGQPNVFVASSSSWLPAVPRGPSGWPSQNVYLPQGMQFQLPKVP